MWFEVYRLLGIFRAIVSTPLIVLFLLFFTLYADFRTYKEDVLCFQMEVMKVSLNER